MSSYKMDDGTFSVMIRNLHYRTSPDDLRPMFEKYGRITDVYIPIDRRTGESRGFGFVRYPNESAAEDAVSGLDGVELHGNRLSIHFAKYDRLQPSRKRARSPPRRGYSPRRSPPRYSSRSPPRRSPPRYRDDRDSRGGYGGYDRDRDRGGYGDRDRGGYGDRDRYRDRSRSPPPRYRGRSRSRSRSRSPPRNRSPRRDSRSPVAQRARYSSRSRSPSPPPDAGVRRQSPSPQRAASP